MPELPEVETVVRYLRPLLVGQRLTRVIRASPLMIQQNDFSTSIQGARVEGIDRQGKWMFARLDRQRILVLHLGMSGRITVGDGHSPEPTHTHVRIELSHSTQEFRFIDPRRFGEIMLLDRSQWEERFGPKRLGPDALTITVEQLGDAVSRSKRVVKAVLMDQRVVAGIGNIYADEILFEARIAPRKKAHVLSRPEIHRIHGACQKVLQKAIAHHGTTVHTFRGVDGSQGDFQSLLAVYGRESKPCRVCGASIRSNHKIISGRSTYWCPDCQPGHPRPGSRKSRNVLPHH